MDKYIDIKTDILVFISQLERLREERAKLEEKGLLEDETKKIKEIKEWEANFSWKYPYAENRYVHYVTSMLMQNEVVMRFKGADFDVKRTVELLYEFEVDVIRLEDRSTECLEVVYNLYPYYEIVDRELIQEEHSHDVHALTLKRRFEKVW